MILKCTVHTIANGHFTPYRKAAACMNHAVEVRVPMIPLLLMASFFVFDICYTPTCSNFYSFMEVIVMNYPIDKAPASVKHLYTSLLSKN